MLRVPHAELKDRRDARKAYMTAGTPLQPSLDVYEVSEPDLV